MQLSNKKIITTYGRPYIVAELNSSHFGKVENAKKMIDAAKECGCDAVKFQSWTENSLYCSDYYDSNPMVRRMVRGFSLSPEKLLALSKYCEEIGIDFSSTPYSKDEVDFLVDMCKAPFVKIASMDINNIPFLRHVARKKTAIVLSTGMATEEEIENAVGVIRREGNDNICVLHCVSVYPVEASAVNLNNVVMLKERFPELAIGYSDHTLGSEVACGAVTLGAGLIEKHFTLDNSKIGWDNQMATPPSEMKNLVESCHNVYLSLGSYKRIINDNELEQRQKMRRSIVSARDLQAGDVIEESDLDAKRPGTGIPVSKFYDLIGKALKNDVARDYMINETDLA